MILDAYQIAENTPRVRHSSDCKALGIGRLVLTLDDGQKCVCWVVDAARKCIARYSK